MKIITKGPLNIGLDSLAMVRRRAGLTHQVLSRDLAQHRLWLHLPQLSFNPVTRLNTGLAPDT
jgi:hypothetical protein